MDVPIEAICSLGVGGAFGMVVFLMYRKDRKSSEDTMRQDRVFMEDRMDKVIEREHEMINRDQVTREANTKALSELNTTLLRLNGRIK